MMESSEDYSNSILIGYYYYTLRKNAEECIAFTRHFSKTVNIARREKILIPLCL